MSQLYPYKLKAKLAPAIWGGDALVRRFGKPGNASEKIGESWECWGENVITNGMMEGRTVNELYHLAGPALVGLAPGATRSQFPFLTKLIDAREALSVQVHPDDRAAAMLEQQKNGKTECWLILEAAPDAEIILGFSQASSEADVRKRVKAGTLGDVLRRIKVKAGDVFFVPAGTVHAIGKGIVLYELQQTSDITYRLFDWNRKDAAGKSRELHVDKAIAALCYEAATATAVRSLSYRVDGCDRTVLIADAHFGLEEIHVAGVARMYTESVAQAVTAKAHAVTIRCPEGTIELEPWATAIIPAGIPRLEFDCAEETSVLVATPGNADQRLRHRLDLIGFNRTEADTYLGQFTGATAVMS